LIITHSTRQLEVQITKPINLIYMTTNRISYIVFIKESDMRCLQSFCYIFCGSKFSQPVAPMIIPNSRAIWQLSGAAYGLFV